MPTATPTLTGERFLDMLAERLLAVYEESLKCERTEVEFRSSKQLIGMMIVKIKREFSELVTFLSPHDPVFDLWVSFEDELDGAIAGVKTAIGIPQLPGPARSLLIALRRMVKDLAPYGEKKAAQISKKITEYDSKRLVGAR